MIASPDAARMWTRRRSVDATGREQSIGMCVFLFTLRWKSTWLMLRIGNASAVRGVAHRRNTGAGTESDGSIFTDTRLGMSWLLRKAVEDELS